MLISLLLLTLLNGVYGTGVPITTRCSNGRMMWEPLKTTVDLVLYRIAVHGFSDFFVKYGDDPCQELQSYCSNQFNEQECFNAIYPELLREILRFSGDLQYLTTDGSLFMRCRSSTLRSNASIFRRASIYNTVSEELLQILCRADHDGLDSTMKVFDMKWNEVTMTPVDNLNLFQAAILVQPNSTYLISKLGLALSAIGENSFATALFENAVERGLWPHVLQRPEITFVPGLESKPWHNKEDFSFIAKLEKGYEIIREELVYNLVERRHIFTGEQENRNIFTGGDWQALQIKSTPGLNSGYTKYSRYFPKTVKILKECNEDFLLVKFSAIKPGTHIEPHTGPSNNRLRTHFTLIHTGGARIRVGSEWRTWTEGKGMILDSSWEHEVIHEGNENRIILILDTWHPNYQLHKD